MLTGLDGPRRMNKRWTDRHLVGKEEIKIVNSHGITTELPIVLRVLPENMRSHVDLFLFLSHYYLLYIVFDFIIY